MIEDTKLQNLCKRVIHSATHAGVTIGTAESCTGGLVCGALTSVPGSSSVVIGGIVSYAIPVKENVLGVSKTITRDATIGVVSSKCAKGMCEGARRVLECDIAISTTGIAGPGGAEPGKPVGTVWFGISSPCGTSTVVCRFTGNRDEVRAKSVEQALCMLQKEIERIGAE